MTFFESIVLGLVQGLTEFLPISSSGHLILAREFLGLSLEGSLVFDVFLNTATLLAVIYCFWGDLIAIVKDFFTQGFSSRSKNLLWAIILGSIPAGFFGFFFGDKIETVFRNSSSVAWALVAGSVLMLVADFLGGKKGGVTPMKGFLVGLFQSLALIPGMSRSGSTISGGLLSGLSREEAIKFSFLLLIPVSLGALLKIIIDFDSSNLSIFNDSIFQLAIAFFAALFSGIWAVKFLIRYLSKNSFTPFIIYRIVLAGVIFLVF